MRYANGLQLQQNTVAHFSTVNHHKTKTSEATDSNGCPGQPWHHREPNHPWTLRIIFGLWFPLVHLCSHGTKADLWLLKLQVMKKTKTQEAGQAPTSWPFTCWLLCHFFGDSFSLCDRQSMIPHDKLDCSSSECCWIILVLSIASPAPEIFLYCCLWAISLDSHHCRYSICSVTPKANEMC